MGQSIQEWSKWNLCKTAFFRKILSDMVCLKMMEGTFFRSISHERTKIRDTPLAFLQLGLKSNWSKKLFFKKVEAYCKIA